MSRTEKPGPPANPGTSAKPGAPATSSPPRPARQRREPGWPLRLSLQFADPRHRELLPRHRVARWLRQALAAPAQITLRVVGLEEGLELNRRFRQQDHATNVLTFDYERTPVVLADLVLCAPVVEAEAQAQRIPLLAHYAHLVVHGALHAQGFDHQADAQALQMEARESEILRRLGFDHLP